VADDDEERPHEPRHAGTARLEERGTTTIADKVVERIAVIAAREVDAVTQGGGWTRLVGRGLPRVSAVVAGGTSRVSVEVATAWPKPLSAVATHVRDHVSERVTALSGITVTAVDVTVADVVHVDSAQRRVE
jgi:uncharacterized alkaline shock family protein YloU